MASNGTDCPHPMKATSNGVFQGDSPLDYALPLIILQICLVLVFTRFLAYLLKPMRQPRVVAEIVVSLTVFLVCVRGHMLSSKINEKFFSLSNTCLNK